MEQTLKAVISEVTGIHPREIEDNVTFEELQIDSLDLVDIVMELEELYDIQINDQEFEYVEHTTFLQISNFLKEKAGLKN